VGDKENKAMKTVLCYGDSNTWGADPTQPGRFGPDIRWPAVMRTTLGADYWVIEEGLNGRTTVWDDPIEGNKNGKTQLPSILLSHHPFELIIIMLGTNDLKMRFSVPAYDIAGGAGVLVDIVNQSGCGPNGGAPQVLLMAPPPIAKLTEFAPMFEGGDAKSKLFAQEYARVAQLKGCHFFNAGSVIVASDADGIHFDASEHIKLGKAVAAEVRKILG
jgi:lysophospholipase L1-like esterase